MIIMAAVPTRIRGLRLKATIRPIPSTEPGMTKGNMTRVSIILATLPFLRTKM